MKKLILIMMLMLSVFLIGCVEHLSDQELAENLNELSDEEIAYVLSEDTSALAGEAFQTLQIRPVVKTLKKEVSSSIKTQYYWECWKANCQALYNQARITGNYNAYRDCSLSCQNSANNLGGTWCYDADGRDFFSKSKVNSTIYPLGKEDYCTNFSYGRIVLIEGICLDNHYAQLQKNCSELGNYVCQDGRCVEIATRWCNDTDGGMNYNLKGIISSGIGVPNNVNIYVRNDTCYNDRLFENYCDLNNIPQTINVTCELGCYDGACVE